MPRFSCDFHRHRKGGRPQLVNDRCQCWAYLNWMLPLKWNEMVLSLRIMRMHWAWKLWVLVTQPSCNHVGSKLGGPGSSCPKMRLTKCPLLGEYEIFSFGITSLYYTNLPLDPPHRSFRLPTNRSRFRMFSEGEVKTRGRHWVWASWQQFVGTNCLMQHLIAVLN